MIGEASTLVSQYNVDRVYKENSVRPENRASSSSSAEESATTGNVTDTTSFSPEALAKARQVEPAQKSAEEEQMESTGNPQNLRDEPEGPIQAANFVNIRV